MPRPTSSSTRPAPPGTDAAVRGTIGVVVGYAAALLVAGLVGVLADDVSGQAHSAGAERAQLAVQAIAFAGAALLLVESLRLARPPAGADPLASSSRAPIPWPLLLGTGAVASLVSGLAGPVVSALLPGLSDPSTPVGSLGVGTGQGADLGTVIVVAGLIPLGEELLFRGVLAGAWVRAGRPGMAVVVSTVLFSLAHVTVGERTMAVTLLLGLVFALAYVFGRSLGAAVLAHALVNAGALVDAGLRDSAAIVLLVVVVGVATAVASRLSPLVSWAPPGGTLTP